MTLDKKISKRPYFWLDDKPDLTDDYFFITPPNIDSPEPVSSARLPKLLKWALGCLILMLSYVPNVLAYRQFSGNSEALTWIFWFGFWLVLVFMTFTLKGINGNRIGLLAFLQMMFAIVIGLNFWQYSSIVATGVIAMGSGVLMATFTRSSW